MRVLITLLLLVSASTVVAQECDSSDDTVNFRSRRDNRDWDETDTWEECVDQGGTYAWVNTANKPGSTNFVTIRAGHHVTVDTTESCRNLHVEGQTPAIDFLYIIGELTVHGGDSSAAQRTSTIDRYGKIQLSIDGKLIFATHNHVLVKSNGSGKLIEGNSNTNSHQAELIIDGVTLTIKDGQLFGSLEVYSGDSPGHLVNAGEVKAGNLWSLELFDLGSIQGSGDWVSLDDDDAELRFLGTECVTSLTGDFIQTGDGVIRIGSDALDVDVSTSGTLSGSVVVESGSKFCYDCSELTPVCDPSGACACSAP